MSPEEQDCPAAAVGLTAACCSGSAPCSIRMVAGVRESRLPRELQGISAFRLATSITPRSTRRAANLRRSTVGCAIRLRVPGALEQLVDLLLAPVAAEFVGLTCLRSGARYLPKLAESLADQVCVLRLRRTDRLAGTILHAGWSSKSLPMRTGSSSKCRQSVARTVRIRSRASGPDGCRGYSHRQAAHRFGDAGYRSRREPAKIVPTDDTVSRWAGGRGSIRLVGGG